MHRHLELSEASILSAIREKGLSTDLAILLSDVSNRWRKAIEGAEHAIVLSPYLTSNTAERILTRVEGSRCQIYTAFRVENFASRASSIRTLQRLQEHGCALYHLPDVHAKIVLVPGSFVSVGSQNLTRRGKSNKEATCAFDSPEAASIVEELVGPWLAEAKPISSEMIDQVILGLEPLLASMRKLQRRCTRLELKVWWTAIARNEELNRIEAERQAQELARKAEQERRSQLEWRVGVQKLKLDMLVKENAENGEMARQLIAASTWWLTHPRGRVKAPNHQYNVKERFGNWQIKFGANYINLSLAIELCQISLNSWLTSRLSDKPDSFSSLLWALEDAVTMAVFHQRGVYYNNYPVNRDFMRLGGAGVNVREFATEFLRLTGTLDQFPEG